MDPVQFVRALVKQADVIVETYKTVAGRPSKSVVQIDEDMRAAMKSNVRRRRKKPPVKQPPVEVIPEKTAAINLRVMRQMVDDGIRSMLGS